MDEAEGNVTQSELPSMSDEAKQLLLEASEDRNGIVQRYRLLDGMHVETNNKQLAENGNPRSEAKWVAAVDDLIKHGLLESSGNRGEAFAVTRKGYDVADRLKQQ